MARRGGLGDSGFSDLLHGLRNAATSVSLALQFLDQSKEVRSSAGLLRLRIAHKELEIMRSLLDELGALESDR